jgi:hypothetical protein
MSHLQDLLVVLALALMLPATAVSSSSPAALKPRRMEERVGRGKAAAAIGQLPLTGGSDCSVYSGQASACKKAGQCRYKKKKCFDANGEEEDDDEAIDDESSTPTTEAMPSTKAFTTAAATTSKFATTPGWEMPSTQRSHTMTRRSTQVAEDDSDINGISTPATSHDKGFVSTVDPKSANTTAAETTANTATTSQPTLTTAAATKFKIRDNLTFSDPSDPNGISNIKNKQDTDGSNSKSSMSGKTVGISASK